MNADELEAEGMAPAAVPYVLCGIVQFGKPWGPSGSGACVFMPHTEGSHSWQVERLHIRDEGPRIGGSYGGNR